MPQRRHIRTRYSTDMKLFSPFTRIILLIQFAFAAYRFIKRIQTINTKRQTATVNNR
jgi:hypothetical protein